MTHPVLLTPVTLDAHLAARVRSAEVVVLAGGTSGEREVSLDSGAEILRALHASDERGPARARLVEIDPQGRWGWNGERYGACEALQKLGPVDVFFLAVHGGSGEDGSLQGLLEYAGARYTGSSVRASALCMDKRATRALALDAGLRVAPGHCWSAAEVLREPARALALARGLGACGWAVKPRSGGSSVATFVLAADGDLEAALLAVARTGDDVLVEARVEGVECSCGVLERPGQRPLALPPIEIQPLAGRFFDYQQKYSADGAREVCPPESIGAEAAQLVQTAAVQLFEITGCRGHARIDFIVPADGNPVLLEANTLPGFTSRSLLPKEAACVGLDYRSLCLLLLGNALGNPLGSAARSAP